MRIGIDARLCAYRGGGIPEHVRRLVAGLRHLDPPEDIVVLAHRRGAANHLPGPTRRLLTPPHHPFEGWLLPAELATCRLSLFHATDMVVPTAWRGPAVVTIHDLAFMAQPALVTPATARYYAGVQRSVRRARLIITVSQHTRDQVLAHTAADIERIRVVPNAVPAAFFETPRAGHDEAVLRRHKVARGEYILFVGTIEPRKNLTTLLDAFAEVRRRAPALSLALVGAEGWLSEAVYEGARRQGGGAVRFLGVVDGEDLPALYRGAAVVAHPALDEGFGMTVAEAMAVGAPVVASRAGSLPEVAGDAAVLVPPLDAEAWADAILRVVDDSARAGDLAARGRERAAGLTVEAMARRTLAVYREALP